MELKLTAKSGYSYGFPGQLARLVSLPAVAATRKIAVACDIGRPDTTRPDPAPPSLRQGRASPFAGCP
jgi:hypothetical protein